jgi:hypothetical protein
VIAALALLLLVLAAYFSRGRGPRAGLWLVAVSVLWLVCNKPVEGPIMVTVSENHGVTGADLAGIGGVVLGLHQAWPLVVRRARLLASNRQRHR